MNENKQTTKNLLKLKKKVLTRRGGRAVPTLLLVISIFSFEKLNNITNIIFFLINHGLPPCQKIKLKSLPI